DPFVYFDDIVNSTARCSRIVPANSGEGGPGNLFLSDLASPSAASNFMWLTPNLCDDMHDSCSAPYNSNQIAQGDSYLSTLIPQILNSTLFRHQKAAFIITFDAENGSSAIPKTTILS